MAEVFAAAKPHRTWPQRLLIAFNVMCMVGALVTAGVLGYSNRQLSAITRVGGLRNVLTPEQNRPPDAPTNYLIVGADEAAGLAPDDPVNRGRTDAAGSFRTDTIMILRIDPQDATARVLSVPRDLWVKIPGLKYPNKINAAVEGDGGALRLIETIKNVFGISIEHYVQVNFAGFKQLVTDIGGVPIYFPEAVRVLHSTPFKIPAPGCYTLDGNQALDFVRTRKDYQVMHDGRWRTDLSGDLGRISRQQYFIQVALKRAFSQGIRDPNTLRKLIDHGIGAVKIDDQLKIEDLLSLGNRFRNFNPANLQKFTVPSVRAFHGGADAQDIVESEAEPILAIFRGTASANPAVSAPVASDLAPENVKLQLQNGGGVRGRAREVTDEFTALGFSTIVPADAPGSFATTTVRYVAAKVAMARYVARFITGDVDLQQIETPPTGGADVVVVIGRNWRGTEATPKPDDRVPVPSTTSTTSTTAPTPTTSTSAGSSPPTMTTVIGNVPSTPPGVTCG